MDKIKWCLGQKRGIELIEPNENLSQAYLADADDSMGTMDRVQGKWEIITAYYACYNAFYALLMKAGIKSEIHDCTLALMSLFDFTAEQRKYLNDLKKNRINVQYYLKKPTKINTQEIKSFVVACKTIIGILNPEKISTIRELVKND